MCSGIGKAASIALAKLGASVVLVCRDRVRGEAAMAQITSAASGSRGAPSLELADLAPLDQVRALAARLAGLPGIDRPAPRATTSSPAGSGTSAPA
jgi:NAD(P)-dependent dehydrogenase (short-subunit alcohol dehydrogenase family)